ncbi:hypothetical protein PG997_002737 [Apiospora hydei]|uniref:Uncharacterized protein n=1 Tax=Apiospora hydei TaxID=1337664 RepID=A0ABR1WX90_9PEZI
MAQRSPSPPSPPPRWGPLTGTPELMNVYNTGGDPASGLSPKSDSSAEEPENRLEDVKTYFTNAGLRFRKAIATGNHGGTLLFDQYEKRSDDGPTTPPVLEKSLVVKYALDTRDDASTNNDDDLSNEMFWLEKFVYAQHIIQLAPEYRKLCYDEQEGAGWISC